MPGVPPHTATLTLILMSNANAALDVGAPDGPSGPSPTSCSLMDPQGLQVQTPSSPAAWRPPSVPWEQERGGWGGPGDVQLPLQWAEW